MIYLMIYLIHIMDALRITAGVSLVLIPITFFSFFLACDDDKKIKKHLKTFVATIIIAILTLITIPTKETMYQLSAVYIGKQLNSTVQFNTKIQKVSQIIDLKLDKIIKENVQ